MSYREWNKQQARESFDYNKRRLDAVNKDLDYLDKNDWSDVSHIAVYDLRKDLWDEQAKIEKRLREVALELLVQEKVESLLKEVEEED